MESYFGEEIGSILAELKTVYEDGFVVNVSQKKAPPGEKSLKKYLAKYLSSPPISLRRILEYDGTHVCYCYQDHVTKKKLSVKVPVFVFIGRMVQHLRVKGFQKLRYYGLQATKLYRKLRPLIEKSLKSLGKRIEEVIQVSLVKKWRERMMEGSGKDPLRCIKCNMTMNLWYLWNPKSGIFYDAYKSAPNIKKDPPIETRMTSLEDQSVFSSQLCFMQ